jgi:hypothetical protein
MLSYIQAKLQSWRARVSGRFFAHIAVPLARLSGAQIRHAHREYAAGEGVRVRAEFFSKFIRVEPFVPGLVDLGDVA